MPTVLLIDDHAMFRDSLAQALEQADASLRLLTADRGDAALAQVETGAPDAAILDYYMPGLGGDALIAQLVRRHPRLPILVLSASEDPEDARNALSAGARGFVHKSADAGGLLRALHRILRGERGVVATAPPQEALVLQPQDGPPQRLTARQTQVLQLVAEGLRNAAIAQRLGTSEKTVKAHLSVIFAVLGVASRTQAGLQARRLGLLGKPQ
jgi:DNA-binding NarL/FixJ family response regulator